MEPTRPSSTDGSGAGNPPTRQVSKIQHTKPGIIMPPGRTGNGGDIAGGSTSVSTSTAGSSSAPLPVAGDEHRPLPVAPAAAPGGAGMGKITAFGRDRKHEESWTRTPNTTGNGAIHVKTFHCKLTEDAIAYMDQSINEWLDAHPQYEVKFVSSTIGTITGKLKEPALFCQVWV